MPIELTTPFDPGDNDPGETYPRAKITLLSLDLQGSEIQLTASFGDVVDDAWVRGPGSRNRGYEITGEDFTTLMATATLDGETIYVAAKRIAYAWLQDNHSEYAGTIE